MKRNRSFFFKNSKMYLYGAGQIGHDVSLILKNDIIGIFDKRYDELKTLNGIPVMNPAEIINLNPEESIIIFSVGNSIMVNSIMMCLTEKWGWIRNTNLFYYSDFLQYNFMEYQLLRREKLHIPDFTISITTKCSLQCTNCSQQLHRIRHRLDRNINDLITDIALLFKYIDHIDRLAIIGGEPFLYSNLKTFLRELVKYSDQYTECRIVTNATILPSKDLLFFMSENNISMELTSYNVVQSKITYIIQECEALKVKYAVNTHDYWLKMWNDEPHATSDETKWIFNNCVKANHCAGMCNGHITICTCAYIYMLGKDDFCKSDYLDLYQTQSKETIFKYLSGCGNHLIGCRFCNGLYVINDKKIPVGEQLT